MHKISNFIAEIDFLVSGTIGSIKYFYNKPVIPSTEDIPSYIKTTKLRDIIVERLCTETEFIPNDIQLGNVPSENSGKCLDPETPVIMHDGFIKLAKMKGLNIDTSMACVKLIHLGNEVYDPVYDMIKK